MIRSVLAVVGLLVASAPAVAASQDLIDTKAPAFSLPSDDGQAVSLDSFKGKHPVVLAFFPKAFTPG